MGFINRIEQGLEKAVRSTFSKGGGDFEPVDLANRIRTDMDDKAYSISSGRTIAPNIFTLNFAEEDFPRLQDWGAPLAEELCDVVIRHARAQGYSLRGSVRVTFTVDDAITPGEFTVVSSQDKVASSFQEPRPATQPAPVQRHAAASQAAAPAGGALRQTAFDEPVPSRVSTSGPRAPRLPRTAAVDPFNAPTQLSPRVHRAEPSRVEPYQQQAPRVILEINGEGYSINSLPLVLGRGSNADITLDDSGVSRRHLEIIEQDGVYLAVDLGSTNGTSLNGQKLTGRRELTNGSVLTMGRTRIVFRLVRGER